MTNRMAQQIHVFSLQVLFFSCVSLGTFAFNLDDFLWTTTKARYVFYILLIRGSELVCWTVYTWYWSYPIDWKLLRQYRGHAALLVAATGVLLYSKQKLFQEDLPFLFGAYLVVKYLEMEHKSSEPPVINYGVGMACSFFEGYLTTIIPSDGAHFASFEEKINKFEASQGVVFPVKRLFIVITKSLYCPPDMKAFNKSNRDDLPYMEALKSLEEVEKDVAGVKNRSYRNSAYKIYRPGGKEPICISAEFATPVNTLYRVLQKPTVYSKLVDADVPKILDDFYTTLKETMAKCPELRNKCELVRYDDKDPEQNLADVFLNKIQEIEPDFENIIRKKLATMVPAKQN